MRSSLKIISVVATLSFIGTLLFLGIYSDIFEVLGERDVFNTASRQQWGRIYNIVEFAFPVYFFGVIGFFITHTVIVNNRDEESSRITWAFLIAIFLLSSFVAFFIAILIFMSKNPSFTFINCC